MPATVVVGAQWGDEGKGKITDLMAEEAEMVVRSRAATTRATGSCVGGEEFKLHLVPSGMLYPGQDPA